MSKSIPLDKPVITIGRMPGNDVVLPNDPQVSRRHAEIRREGTALVLHDLNSRNGTFVNGAQITRQTLYEGDQIRVGNTELYLQGGALWVPDDAFVQVPAVKDTPILAVILGIGGLLLLGLAVLFATQLRSGAQPPLRGVVAVAGGAATSGSGVVIDRRGLILTANSALGGNPEPLVGLIARPEVPPATWFQTRVVVADPDLDLAVLKVTNQVSGEPIPGPLDLPALTLGNSDGLEEGQVLKVVGYPAVGLPLPGPFGETVRVQDAVVARFQIWPGGTRQWIELDRDIENLGYRGGPVLDEQDQLVGISLPDPGAPRRVRPINLALGLIRQAQVALGW